MTDWCPGARRWLRISRNGSNSERWRVLQSYIDINIRGNRKKSSEVAVRSGSDGRRDERSFADRVSNGSRMVFQEEKTNDFR